MTLEFRRHTPFLAGNCLFEEQQKDDLTRSPSHRERLVIEDAIEKTRKFKPRKISLWRLRRPLQPSHRRLTGFRWQLF